MVNSSIHPFIGQAHQSIQSKMQSDSWKKVIDKKIVFQTILDKYRNYVLDPELEKQTRSLADGFGASAPPRIYAETFKAIKTGKHYQEFSLETQEVIDLLIAVFEQSIPHSEAIDHARTLLYPRLESMIQQGDGVAIGSLQEGIANGHHLNIFNRWTFDSKKAQVTTALTEIAVECTEAIRNLSPGQYFLLPTGNIQHETKTLITKSPEDGSYTFCECDSGYGTIKCLILPAESLNVDVIAQKFIAKIDPATPDQSAFRRSAGPFKKNSWVTKKSQMTGSCSMQSLVGIIKICFYLHYNGSAEGLLAYKLFTSVFHDTLMENHGGALDPVTLGFAQLRTGIKRRYRIWQPFIRNDELFQAAARSFEFFLEQIPTIVEVPSTPLGKIKHLQGLHDQLTQHLKHSDRLGSLVQLPQNRDPDTLLSPTFSAALLKQLKVDQEASQVIHQLNILNSTTTKLMNALRAHSHQLPMIPHSAYPTIRVGIRPFISGYESYKGTENPKISLEKLTEELLLLDEKYPRQLYDELLYIYIHSIAFDYPHIAVQLADKVIQMVENRISLVVTFDLIYGKQGKSVAKLFVKKYCEQLYESDLTNPKVLMAMIELEEIFFADSTDAHPVIDLFKHLSHIHGEIALFDSIKNVNPQAIAQLYTIHKFMDDKNIKQALGDYIMSVWEGYHTANSQTHVLQAYGRLDYQFLKQAAKNFPNFANSLQQTINHQKMQPQLTDIRTNQGQGLNGSNFKKYAMAFSRAGYYEEFGIFPHRCLLRLIDILHSTKSTDQQKQILTELFKLSLHHYAHKLLATCSEEIVQEFNKVPHPDIPSEAHFCRLGEQNLTEMSQELAKAVVSLEKNGQRNGMPEEIFLRHIHPVYMDLLERGVYSHETLMVSLHKLLNTPELNYGIFMDKWTSRYFSDVPTPIATGSLTPICSSSSSTSASSSNFVDLAKYI